MKRYSFFFVFFRSLLIACERHQNIVRQSTIATLATSKNWFFLSSWHWPKRLTCNLYVLVLIRSVTNCEVYSSSYMHKHIHAYLQALLFCAKFANSKALNAAPTRTLNWRSTGMCVPWLKQLLCFCIVWFVCCTVAFTIIWKCKQQLRSVFLISSEPSHFPIKACAQYLEYWF